MSIDSATELETTKPDSLHNDKIGQKTRQINLIQQKTLELQTNAKHRGRDSHLRTTFLLFHELQKLRHISSDYKIYAGLSVYVRKNQLQN